MTIIPDQQRNQRYFIFAMLWLLLGVAGLIVTPENYFFYGYPILGMVYLYVYFTGSWERKTNAK